MIQQNWKEIVLLLGVLTTAKLTEGFGSNLALSRIESRFTKNIHYGNTPEFSVVEDGAPYMPPDFSIDDDPSPSPFKSPSPSKSKYSPPGFTVEDDGDSYSESAAPTPRGPRRPKRKAVPSMKGTSWMQKNVKYSNEPDPAEVQERSKFRRSDSPRDGGRGHSPRDGGRGYSPRDSPRDGGRGYSPRDGPSNFRENFRATRVFVQGVPPGISWQDLKDHFRVAGEVVFASVSVDMDTGVSRGHGIVQFEDSDMAQNAIKIMRDHPMNGSSLYVREDVQESKNGASLKPKGPTPPTKWKCANEDNAAYLDEGEISAIRQLIKARDDARRRRKYDVSDNIRDELKQKHGVFIDDRLRMWWTSIDGQKVPKSIHEIKGDGKWKIQSFRQIPTTPENDACVNPELVSGLLQQRDIARREKDFDTADALLEEARTCPDGDLNLRIHDESRTWRVWTEAPPVHAMQQAREDRDPREIRTSAAKECIRIVEEHAPHKMDEITTVLQKFKGREFQVLKRLKDQYDA